jgi:hypothetical protein
MHAVRKVKWFVEAKKSTFKEWHISYNWTQISRKMHFNLMKVRENAMPKKTEKETQVNNYSWKLIKEKKLIIVLNIWKRVFIKNKRKDFSQK